MVIVTTAVYWRFNSKLPHHTDEPLLLLTFQHRAGVSPHTSQQRFAWTCVFSKQSLLPSLCDHHQLPQHVGSPTVAPLLPKLRGQFAEFLNFGRRDRKSTRLNSSHVSISYAVFCLNKKSTITVT